MGDDMKTSLTLLARAPVEPGRESGEKRSLHSALIGRHLPAAVLARALVLVVEKCSHQGRQLREQIREQVVDPVQLLTAWFAIPGHGVVRARSALLVNGESNAAARPAIEVWNERRDVEHLPRSDRVIVELSTLQHA